MTFAVKAYCLLLLTIASIFAGHEAAMTKFDKLNSEHRRKLAEKDEEIKMCNAITNRCHKVIGVLR